MERIISEQDRIRRAEEIANRRREKISARSINISSEKKKLTPLNKIIIQIITSMCIFGIAYLGAQNNVQIKENIQWVLAQDINFEELYNKGNESVKYIMSKLQTNNEVPVEESIVENVISENQIDSNTVKENVVDSNNHNQEERQGIGGSDENTNLSQDEQDVAYVKQNVSMIVPVYGTITSPYGKREATEIISENHAGIDIGANTGTEIIAAMDGKVEVVSSYGDYGNHVKITNGEVSTLYAHCNIILVKEGEEIKQGQKIAEVGNTGRTTGPHLHFEISRNSRTINPQEILEI